MYIEGKWIMVNRLFMIIGTGSGQREDFTREARDAIARAGLVLSTERLSTNLAGAAKVRTCPFGKLAENALSSHAARIAILVSGDTGFFSAAKSLRQKLTEHGEVQTICGLTSMQLLCAKLGTPFDDVVWLSLHGRKGSLLGTVSYNRRVFALTGGEQNAQQLCRTLVEAGLGHLRVSRGENLGASNEQILAGTAAELAEKPCGDLAVLLVENEQPGECCLPVRDSDMERGSVPMTKQEARWAAVNLLDLRASDIVYDIGAGTGSVSMEMARRVQRGLVYAIERSIDGIALIDRNRRALGCWNVLLVEGDAPGAMQGLPVPDAAFIGGSGGTLHETLAILKERNPKIRIVITAVSLETLGDAQQALSDLAFENITISQLSAVRGHKADSNTPLHANNPIFLLSGGVR